MEVDWHARPENWRERDYTVTRRDQSAAEHANLTRAQVVAGIIAEGEFAFAEHLDPR